MYISDSGDHITEQGRASSGLRLLPENTVLIVFRSGILKHTLPVAVNLTPLCINQDIKALIPMKHVHPEYLAFYFIARSEKLLPLITKHSTTVQSINTQEFNSLVIPVPPLDKQRELVADMRVACETRNQKLRQADDLLASLNSFLLSQLDLVIAEEEHPMAYATRLKDAWRRADADFHSPKFDRLRRALEKSDCRMFTVRELCLQIKTGFAAGREVQAFDEETGMPHIRPLNISQFGDLTFEGTKYVPRDAVPDSEIIGNEEVLFNNTNSTKWVGKTAVFEDERVCCCSNHITRLMIDRKIVEPRFLASLFNAIRSTGYLGLVATNFVNQAGLNSDTLGNIRLPVPDLKKQQELVKELWKRREKARQLWQEAEKEWQTAKQRFEEVLLSGKSLQ